MVALYRAGRSHIMEKTVITKNDLFAIINQAFIDACSAYVIRNDRRYNRYKLDLPKDLKRIKYLLKRSWNRFPLVITEIQETFGVSGWRDINLSDLKIPASADYAEIVALMEYWNLWEYRKEIISLLPSTK